MIEEETERAVIGAVLVHPRVLLDAGRLLPEHFALDHHAAVWSAIRALDAEQKPIDTLTVYAQMQADKTAEKLNQHGGSAYLTELMASVVTVESIEYHAKRVRLAAERRAWRVASMKIHAASSDPSMSAEEFRDFRDREVAKATMDAGQEGGPRRIGLVLRSAVKTIERRAENASASGVCGVPSGLREVDEMTLGFQPGDLVVIAARPSMGKTALAMNAVRESGALGYPALVLSLEMTAEGLAERLIASHGRLLSRDLRTGQMSEEAWVRLHRAASDLSVRPLEIDDRGEVDIGEIRRTVRHWRARQQKSGIVVLDYLQLIASSPGAREENRAREVAIQSRALKILAKEVSCPIVALAQLNRGLEARADKRPMMSDLKESGAIEQDADVIAFLYRDHVYNHDADPTEAEINIAKQRNGPTGTVTVKWNPMTQRFEDA